MNSVYWLGHRLFRESAKAFFDLRVIGAEHAAISGPAILASNHVSYLDPPFIGAALNEDIYFLARKTLARLAPVAWLFRHWQVIPVDRDKPDPSSLKSIFQRLEEGKKVILFPEGTRSPDGSLQAAEPGIGMIISRAKVPVIPVRIFGAHEALPRDKKLPRPARITVAFGPAWHCDPESYGIKGKAAYPLIADDVMHRLASLKAQ
jgi:1-acyl-sn-glycerol-3-phosphate acyltransferase